MKWRVSCICKANLCVIVCRRRVVYATLVRVELCVGIEEHTKTHENSSIRLGAKNVCDCVLPGLRHTIEHEESRNSKGDRAKIELSFIVYYY